MQSPPRQRRRIPSTKNKDLTEKQKNQKTGKDIPKETRQRERKSLGPPVHVGFFAKWLVEDDLGRNVHRCPTNGLSVLKEVFCLASDPKVSNLHVRSSREKQLSAILSLPLHPASHADNHRATSGIPVPQKIQDNMKMKIGHTTSSKETIRASTFSGGSRTNTLATFRSRCLMTG